MSTAAAPHFETAAGPQPAPEPALFSHLYAQPQELSDDEERPRRFDYRIAVLAALLIAVVVLGYRQRHNAQTLYLLARQAIAQQLDEFWAPQKSVVSEKRETSAQKENPTKSHVRTRRVVKKFAEPAVAASKTMPEARPSFLRVRVEGQPSPDVVSNVLSKPQGAFMGDLTTSGPQVLGPRAAPPFAVTISPQESLSLLLKQVPPVYPADARAANAIGPVVLKALIHKDGNVGDLSVVSGNPLLIQAAVDAVRQWVYRPYYRNGEPTEVDTVVVVDFPISDHAGIGRNPGN